MARIGINPFRGKLSDYRPARVTVALLTCIPHLEGYHRHKLEVLKRVLGSVLEHTTPPYDLMVFDNGSCRPVIEHLSQLKDEGAIDYLMLSPRNLGKIGAFHLLFNAAPGELIAYSDDDVLYYPGWLEAHLQILETFPQVGMVSGAPVRDRASRANTTLQRLRKEGAPGIGFTEEQRITDEWEADWASSTGRDPHAHLQATQDHQDVVLHKDGVEALGTATHFQFLSPKAVLTQALPEDWSGKLMGDMVELDEAIDRLGYLRLTTVERYTRHLGNSPDPDAAHIQAQSQARPGQRTRHWLLRVPGMGRLLRALYDRLFVILHRTD